MSNYDKETSPKEEVTDPAAATALKHHTSKLNSFDDLASVSTLGFRGEALSSLCGVATLSITTCTSPSLPLGTALSFTPAGELQVESAKRVSRSRGTTVKVEKLFENLPVRRKELSKNAKREMGKAIELVQAYALINTGVRFEVRNIVKGYVTVVSYLFFFSSRMYERGG